MSKRNWFSYECAWTHKHSQCDGSDCACYCHDYLEFDDDEDPWWAVETPFEDDE